MSSFSGDWRAVNPAVDLETTPLEIKTNSTLGSRDEVRVHFYNSQGDLGGGTWIYFSSTLQYLIPFCTVINRYTNFPSNLPTAVDKVWRITRTRTSVTRLKIHCNDVEVLNLLPSETCETSNWKDTWSKKVEKIFFASVDTASDYYRLYQQGKGKKYVG